MTLLMGKIVEFYVGKIIEVMEIVFSVSCVIGFDVFGVGIVLLIVFVVLTMVIFCFFFRSFFKVF